MTRRAYPHPFRVSAGPLCAPVWRWLRERRAASRRARLETLLAVAIQTGWDARAKAKRCFAEADALARELAAGQPDDDYLDRLQGTISRSRHVVIGSSAPEPIGYEIPSNPNDWRAH